MGFGEDIVIMVDFHSWQLMNGLVQKNGNTKIGEDGEIHVKLEIIEFDSNSRFYQLVLVLWVISLFKLSFYVRVGLGLFSKQIFFC